MAPQVRPARLDWLEALQAGDDVFTTRFGIPVVEGWVGFPEALPHAVADARAHPDDPWRTQLIFDSSDGALVGCGGFKGPPLDGEVELGYAIAPSRQGRGLATAFVETLIQRAREAGVTTITANTLGEENASTRVLRNNQFVKVGDVPDPDLGITWRWELVLAD